MSYGELRGKESKAQAAYHPTTSKDRRCGKCRYMQHDGSCTMVKGQVEPNSVCNYFDTDKHWEGND